MKVRFLFQVLRSSVGIVGLLAAASLAIAAYIWHVRIKSALVELDDRREFTPRSSSIAAFAAVLLFSSTILVSTVVGCYGVCNKYRAPLFSYMLVAISCSVLQVPGLVVVAINFHEDAILLETTLGTLVLVLLACSAGMLFFALLILGLLCVDPHGTSIYEEDLSWCGPGGATKYIIGSSAVVCVMGVVLLSTSLTFFLNSLSDEAGDAAADVIPHVNWTVPSIIVASAVTIAASFFGLIGGYHHLYISLVLHIVIELIAQTYQVACALLILFDAGSVQNDVEDTDGDGNSALLGRLSMVGVLGLIIGGFQITLTLFVAMVTVTDATAVYKADYL